MNQVSEQPKARRVRVLEVPGRLGLVTRDQIHRYLYSGKHQDSTHDVIKGLEPELLTHKVINFKGQGQGKYLYHLTDDGHKFLVREGCSRNDLVRPSEVPKELSIAEVQHWLGSNEPLVKARQLERLSPRISITKLVSERILRRHPVQGVVPDGLLYLSRPPTGKAGLTFEWDRSTIPMVRIIDRFRAYCILDTPPVHPPPNWEPPFGMDNIACVWLTPTDTRRDQLLRACDLFLEKSGNQAHLELFHFGTMEPDTDPIEFYFGKRFYHPGDSSPHSLLFEEWNDVSLD